MWPPPYLLSWSHVLQILSSQYLDYRALLRVLPSSRLLELRALLLERLGRLAVRHRAQGIAL